MCNQLKHDKVFDEKPSKDNMSWNVFIYGYNQEEDCVCIMTKQYQLKYNDSGGGTGISRLEGSHVTPTSFNHTKPPKNPLWHCHIIVCLSQQPIEVRNGEVPKQVTSQFNMVCILGIIRREIQVEMGLYAITPVSLFIQRFVILALLWIVLIIYLMKRLWQK